MKEHLFRINPSRNERGFILPITLIIVFLLVSLVLQQIKVYETEKRFFNHQEEMVTIDQLLQIGAVDLEKRLSSDPKLKSGEFSNENGKVVYENLSLPDDTDLDRKKVLRFTLTAQTGDNGSSHSSQVYYDKDKKKIIRWVEPIKKVKKK